MNCPLECKPFFVSPLQFFDSKIVQEVSASLFASNILGGNQGGIKNIYKYFIKLFYMVIFLIQTSLQSLLPFMGTYRKSPPPSKYFLGFASGLRLRMWVSVKGIFATSTLLDNLIPTWTNLHIFQQVVFVGIGIEHNTLMPTNIPRKIVDATGLEYTWGNRIGALKQRMPRLFTSWHSSLYPNLASSTGFEHVLAA